MSLQCSGNSNEHKNNDCGNMKTIPMRIYNVNERGLRMS